MKFGRLTAIRRLPHKKNRAVWLCTCWCGRSAEVTTVCLTGGTTRSCGCLQKELAGKRVATHRMSRKAITGYYAWQQMRQRCYNKKTKQFHNYGGRGIRVCDRWRNSFENFHFDMGDKPSLRHSIDRIDNNGNYTPENCRWALPGEQRNNTRFNVYITSGGLTLTATQWAKKLGVTADMLHQRISMGWDHERVISTPPRVTKRPTTTLRPNK